MNMNTQIIKPSPDPHEFYRNYLDNMLDGCQIIGHDWRYLYLNAAAAVHHRRPNQDLLGQAYTEIWPGIEETKVFAAIKCCLEEHQATHLEEKFVYQDGDTAWFHLSIQPVPEGVFIVSIDITKRMQAEEAYKASQKRFQALIENAPDGISLLGIDGKLRQVTASAAHILGYSPNDARGADPAALTHPEDLPGLLVLLQDLFQNPGKVIRTEYRVRHKDGSWRWLDSTISNLTAEPSVGAIVFNFRDITEQKLAEEALRASEQRFRRYFELGLIGMAITAPEKGFVEVNDRICEILGYERAELMQIRWDEVSHPDDLAADLAHFNRMLSGELNGYSVEKRFLHKTGGIIHTSISVNAVRTEDGSVEYCVALVEDITARKRAEEALRKSEEMYKELFENNPHPMWVYDVKTLAFLMVNDAAVEHYGYSKEEFRAMTIRDIRPAEAIPVLLKNLAQNRAELEKSTGWQHRKKDGSLIDVEVTSHSLLMEDRPARLVLANDITERTQAEEYIRYQASLLMNVSDAIIASEMNGRITNWNPAAEEIYGWQAEEVMGRSVNDVLQTEFNDGRTMADVLQRFLEHGLWRGEVSQLRKDGTKITLLSSVSLVRDDSGAPVAMVAINRDITARKQAERELQTLNSQLEQRVHERTAELNKSNRELEHANRAKDEFLAAMSHELRTPLNSILGLSESLLEQRRGLLNASQEKSLTIIESSGRHLLELINDILDLSKIEAGKFDYYPEVIGVNEISQASLTIVKSLALKKSIKLVYQADQAVSRIYADPRRLKQILVNLLTNAVKFTPEQGHVTLKVNAGADEDLVQFSVIDDGIGIAAKDFERLFQPFEQIDNQLNRQFEGTGLGLALVKRLTDLHGGSVALESEVGKGSCFTINLPWVKENRVQPGRVDMAGHSLLAEEQSLASFTASEQQAEHRCILLAEDHMANILTIREYLESHGYQVIVAHDGMEALEKAQETNPDLILMDIQMPGMDGLEATRRLRTQARFQTTPVIALTALAMPGDRERCLQAGASEYMSKPVRLKSLVITIEEQLRCRR